MTAAAGLVFRPRRVGLVGSQQISHESQPLLGGGPLGRVVSVVSQRRSAVPVLSPVEGEVHGYAPVEARLGGVPAVGGAQLGLRHHVVVDEVAQDGREDQYVGDREADHHAAEPQRGRSDAQVLDVDALEVCHAAAGTHGSCGGRTRVVPSLFVGGPLVAAIEVRAPPALLHGCYISLAVVLITLHHGNEHRRRWPLLLLLLPALDAHGEHDDIAVSVSITCAYVFAIVYCWPEDKRQ